MKISRALVKNFSDNAAWLRKNPPRRPKRPARKRSNNARVVASSAAAALEVGVFIKDPEAPAPGFLF
jgi:hypothetical protein